MIDLASWSGSPRRLRRVITVPPAVTENAVKVAAILGLDNLEAFRSAIHLHRPRLAVRRRKVGCASLAALGAFKIFNPMVSGDHPLNMRSEPCLYQPGSYLGGRSNETAAR
jgi:hypothetical protein